MSNDQYGGGCGYRQDLVLAASTWREARIPPAGQTVVVLVGEMYEGFAFAKKKGPTCTEISTSKQTSRGIRIAEDSRTVRLRWSDSGYAEALLHDRFFANAVLR
jgi:hypothetical protein